MRSPFLSKKYISLIALVVGIMLWTVVVLAIAVHFLGILVPSDLSE